jgi:hypothetical protein|nr:MAG TPA: immunity protein [Caudoviricetes sp.]
MNKWTKWEIAYCVILLICTAINVVICVTR